MLIALGFTPHFAALITCPLSYGVNSLRLGIFLEISLKGCRSLAIMFELFMKVGFGTRRVFTRVAQTYYRVLYPRPFSLSESASGHRLAY